MPGVIDAAAKDGEWRVICKGAREGFWDALRATGGEVISESDPSLEDIFHAHIAGSETGAEAVGAACSGLQAPQQVSL
jgi:hypothetical protein